MNLFNQTTQYERDAFRKQATDRAFADHKIGPLSSSSDIKTAEAAAEEQYQRLCKERATVRGMLMGR